ncbi:MAG: hypothetical protein HQ567_23675 [Candidatus Nealsonbacteria bacterium]|nr:hypothetical protein [Candidatus Nealsonbacteria bacterium]
MTRRLATQRIAKGLCIALTCLVLSAAATARSATGRLEIVVVDRDSGQPIACRMHLVNAAGRPRKPKRAPYWHDHFVFPGKITLDLPLGNYTFDVERGPEYATMSGHFQIDNFADDSQQIELRRFVDMSADGWWSGDLDVRRPVADVELLMQADDLHVAQVVTWPDAAMGKLPEDPPEDPLVRFGENSCYHVMAGAHHRAGTELLLLNLRAPLKRAGLPAPGKVTGEYPPPLAYATAVRKEPGGWVDLTKPFWWDLPMLVAHGQVDSIQLAHSHLCRKTAINNEADGKPRDKFRYPPPRGNARWSQQIYFNLLESGLRIPPTAGSGSGVAPNPVGYNRVYVHVDDVHEKGPLDYGKWWENLRAGRVVVTNGPLMRPSVRGELPGHVFRENEGAEPEFEIALTLSTRKPISYLELIKNGRIEHSISFEDYSKSGRLPKLRFQQSGWFLVRAVTDLPKTYRFAMTGPYYVEIGDRRRISKQAAQFFLDWVYERAKQIKLSDPKQHREVLGYHRQARDFWQDRVQRATAE